MNVQKTKQSTAIYILMLLVPLFWGGAFGAAKHVITEIPSITAAALRFGSAGIILLIIVILRKEWNVAVLKNRWKGLLLMAITGIFSYNAFFFIALNYTSAINGSLVMATTPVLITFGAVLFLGETWSKRIGFGMIMSLVGVFLVIIKGSVQTLLTLSFNMGDLLFLGGLICWAIHGLIGKVVMKGISPLFTTTITMLIGSAFLFIWSLKDGEWGNIGMLMSAQSWFEMGYMVIFATVIAFLLWNEGIHRIGASKASIYMNLIPINAAWIAVLFYDAAITLVQVIGMAMVICGVYFVTSSKKRVKVQPTVQKHAI